LRKRLPLGRIPKWKLIHYYSVTQKCKPPQAPSSFYSSFSTTIKHPPISILLSHHCPKMSTTSILLLVFLLGAVAIAQGNSYSVSSEPWPLPPSGVSGQLINHGLRIDMPEVHHAQGNSYSVSSEPWPLPPSGVSGQLINHGLRIDLPEVHHAQGNSYSVSSEPWPLPPSRVSGQLINHGL
jgi:hypothetical protein